MPLTEEQLQQLLTALSPAEIQYLASSQAKGGAEAESGAEVDVGGAEGGADGAVSGAGAEAALVRARRKALEVPDIVLDSELDGYEQMKVDHEKTGEKTPFSKVYLSRRAAQESREKKKRDKELERERIREAREEQYMKNLAAFQAKEKEKAEEKKRVLAEKKAKAEKKAEMKRKAEAKQQAEAGGKKAEAEADGEEKLVRLDYVLVPSSATSAKKKCTLCTQIGHDCNPQPNGALACAYCFRRRQACSFVSDAKLQKGIPPGPKAERKRERTPEAQVAGSSKHPRLEEERKSEGGMQGDILVALHLLIAELQKNRTAICRHTQVLEEGLSGKGKGKQRQVEGAEEEDEAEESGGEAEESGEEAEGKGDEDYMDE